MAEWKIYEPLYSEDSIGGRFTTAEYHRTVAALEKKLDDLKALSRLLTMLQTQLIAVVPEDPAHWLDKRNAAEALLSCLEQLEDQPGLRPMMLLMQAEANFMAGRWNAAIESYKALLKEKAVLDPAQRAGCTRLLFKDPYGGQFLNALKIIHNIRMICILQGRKEKSDAVRRQYADIIDLHRRWADSPIQQAIAASADKVGEEGQLYMAWEMVFAHAGKNGIAQMLQKVAENGSYFAEKLLQNFTVKKLRDDCAVLFNTIAGDEQAGHLAVIDASGEPLRTSTTEKKKSPGLEKAMAELDELIGLEAVKKEVRSLANFLSVQKLRKEEGLPTLSVSGHLVFYGNPGTGKTTVARLIARIYKELGFLSKGQLIEVKRDDLVAAYLGQTAIKTQEAIDRALGGVLFIDEAYTLADGTSYGQEAIDTILKAMEDHRTDLVVIAAGYPDEMKVFIGANPGLQSRFSRYILFEDYSAAEMLEILRLNCKKSGYELTADAEEWAKTFFEQKYAVRKKGFGNARNVRNLFEKACAVQADRLAQSEGFSRKDLIRLNMADLTSASAAFDAGVGQ